MSNEKEIKPILSHDIFQPLCDLLGISQVERKFIESMRVEIDGPYVDLEIKRFASKEVDKNAD